MMLLSIKLNSMIMVNKKVFITTLGNTGSNGSALNTIHNNLHHNHTKDTNTRHWDKLGNFTFDEDATGSMGGLFGYYPVWKI